MGFKKTDRVHVYDSRTGKKLTNTVPYSHVLLMPHLKVTPADNGSVKSEPEPEPQLKVADIEENEYWEDDRPESQERI